MLLSINIQEFSIHRISNQMHFVVNRALAASNAEAFGNAISPLMVHIVNPIIEVLFAVAFVVFAYGVLHLVFGEPDSDARTKGKLSAIYGVIGMFIMIAAWGIINLISASVKAI